MKADVLAVVGAQYGSEGKGVIVYAIAREFGVHVRVGGPNAGHSFIENGREWKMQAVPCGWVNRDAMLVLGRGGVFNPAIVAREVAEIEKVDPSIKDRLFIDAYAGVLDERFAKEEGHTSGELHRRIGSTGEGVGAARIARLRRDPGQFRLWKDAAAEVGLDRCLAEDTPALLANALQDGKNVLLEGTQGSGLSLIHGPWPFVTSHDTNAAQLAADVGLPPHCVSRVLLVARTFPIRVAGNSGPLFGELTWAEMSRRLGRKVEERTTVTKKVRRVGIWDDRLMDRAVTINGPTSVALTFLDYICSADEGKSRWEDLSDASRQFVWYIERRWGVRVSLVGTGGPNRSVIRRGAL